MMPVAVTGLGTRPRVSSSWPTSTVSPLPRWLPRPLQERTCLSGTSQVTQGANLQIYAAT